MPPVLAASSLPEPDASKLHAITSAAKVPRTRTMTQYHAGIACRRSPSRSRFRATRPYGHRPPPAASVIPRPPTGVAPGSRPNAGFSPGDRARAQGSIVRPKYMTPGSPGKNSIAATSCHMLCVIVMSPVA